jgi:transposase
LLIISPVRDHPGRHQAGIPLIAVFSFAEPPLLSSHKRASVRELIEAAGATPRFLPPYSPDFNPIEKAFSKLKAMLRKAEERTVNGLWDLIGKLVDIFQPNECANYFSSCGYDPE